MQRFRRASILALLAPFVHARAADAPVLGAPKPWQMGMQPAHSPVEGNIQALNGGVTVTIVLITIFVAALLVYVLWRYRASRNPVASTLSHHSTLEAVWTVLPVLILVGIAIPSFRLVYYEDRTQHADVTVKVTGHQWYWEYGFPDAGNLHFDSYGVPDENLQPGQLRHLAVDNQLVLPVGKNVRILTEGADVIHSFFIPSLGVQRYAIPGRVIETWVRIDAAGDYYGECNQICGMNHQLMPISIHAVSPAEFATWLQSKRAKTSTSMREGATHLAAATER